jgi:hypothetical protein
MNDAIAGGDGDIRLPLAAHDYGIMALTALAISANEYFLA